ncbi:MAG: histidine kinase dimerization/phospho-acceptor domain-containing protein [Candidatus Zixiibacteriota bacterium]
MPLRQRLTKSTEHVISYSSKASRETLDREKMAGIFETAVTINHEVNSPLMAILGNVSLLLRDTSNLDKSLTRKLRNIEKAAKRIQYVTARLLRVTKPISIEYIDGVQMLDITDVTPRED